ncbi:hypothetical protein TRIUR3_19699 [Triticum urartu]|uniref:protein-S-isoprenylcysteine alpha-carbonyl methylesterase n=1 Tax=Triticum urartu TaxID=4572 RepID=M7ZDJ9_TRIUA|nr:hypothetical protein TRIUR3_19699 [Triticum urartu]
MQILALIVVRNYIHLDRLGYRWMRQLLALAIYAILLMPGFLQVGYYYFFSSQVRRSIVYGEQPRNRLDLYIPKDNRRPCPVVAFVTGGAWIIGNFPQGTISDMVSDASQGISFVCNNIASYGGDPNQIYLMGQSAGAHISACALMEQAVKESSGQPISWSVTQINAYFGLSGGCLFNTMKGKPYPPTLQKFLMLWLLASLLVPSRTFVDVLQQAGAQATLLLYEGKTHTDIFIQESSVQRPSKRQKIHGGRLVNVPGCRQQQSKAEDSGSRPKGGFLFHACDGVRGKREVAIEDTRVPLFQIIQAISRVAEERPLRSGLGVDPLRGGRDPLVEDVFSVIYADDATCRNAASAPTPRRLVFEWQLQLARWISPF